jgi:peptidoglycan/LPS O-acetylase OafA/YrhL
MQKFSAVDGLRGWLAWTVVLCHLSLISNIYAKGLGPGLVKAGSASVLVFLIISGFVITHLHLERPEPYGDYLLRRFMRIFPLFAFTCVIGYFTSDIGVYTLSHVPWSAEPGFAPFAISTKEISELDHQFPGANALAHLAMMHGTISNNILPFSPFAFNAPAWSLSLEWQFYLVAPFAIALARHPRTFVCFATVIAAFEILHALGLFGSFLLPSFLPGAAGYFVVGIASRLAYPTIAGTVRHPNVILALVTVLIPLGWDAVPILVWVLFLTGLVADRSAPGTSSFARVYQYLLEGRAANYFGSRSYSVYLSHYLIIFICHALWLSWLPTAQKYATFVGVSAMVLPVTLIIAELLYRGIERPGIAFGSRLAQLSKLRAERRLSVQQR